MVAALVAVFGLASVLPAQERRVPSDSSRISIPGCASDRTFVVGTAPEDQPIRSDIEPGRRFRLNGPRQLLDEIRARERTMIEVTGVVRKSQVSGPGGIAIAGGRIRIGGALPRDPVSNPARDPMFDVVVIDVESWRALPDSCPER